MRGKLGTLTIGQAPRPDITPVIDAVIPGDVSRIHAGVLDGLTRQEIHARFSPGPQSGLLVTRLLDGESVVIDKDATEAAAAGKVAALEAEGCTAILMLCTGSFHKLKTDKAWLLEPERLLPKAVAALIGDRLLGVIVPLPEQMNSERSKWDVLARAPLFAAASPYNGACEALPIAVRVLRARGVDVLLLDCMGFTEDHRRAAEEAGDCPVILSNALVVKLVSEILL